MSTGYLVKQPVRRFEKLEKLIELMETIPSTQYNQNMPHYNNDKPHHNESRFCALGHSYRTGIVSTLNFHAASRYFNIPVATASCLFGSQKHINDILGRWRWQKVTPAHWIKAARKVIAEQELLVSRGLVA